ncbi:D-alanine--poly(phosphoribitol) ligase subunit DltA [Vagococcus carniphilus]|uniref:D-alanine--poly(phosphoribitol) ligase subunit DltA n=1 Tax=Vagococcus carniphilus TaxID=218144 RepID=UPI00289217C6|nr:D-alanine--poly(phosphoribitol) ligase subunit DltA [Vagococcus carniphilus]MDT2832318.1 D-alanine--poly(phosphoribitol) ligase subunit DltA [Vagococcus carniphilus]MDT2840113.1 D-alanine--poly(phosphoribitol) ligase subunit DltA [Vagococcus carniphilus]MDT2855775.1 D-alanine--poly(phosphoribitol) ligase subunit DltA [Vagococcus carniphilus]
MKNKIVETIKGWSEKKPNNIFFDEGEDSLTYLELENMSNSLASYLEKNEESYKNIIVYGGQSSRMVISFLACTKSGHGYIPVDGHTPIDRIKMIYEESEASCVIAIDEWPLDEGNIINLSLFEEITSKDELPSFKNVVTENDVYYTIFTSGTTGKPKGVQITYSNLESFCNWMLKDFDLKTEQRFLCQAPFSFDLSVMDLYPSLLTCGTLVPMEKKMVESFPLLFGSIPKMNLNVWVSTPSLIEICLLNPDFTSEKLSSLENFQFCGEELPHNVAEKLIERFPSASVFNTYGPTEATVAITSVRIIEDVLNNNDRLPLGKVKSDTELVILDDEGKRLSDGEVGEIIIVGPGVSIGYFNNPEKTEEAFFLFEGKPAYKTGDAGLIKNDLLYYKGRLDFQIKWHGYRIELGDIDHHLTMLNKVINACVVPKYNKNHKVQQLVSYIVYDEPNTFDEKEVTKLLKEELSKKVMDYMIPQRFIFVESLPLTANGKVDRKGLINEVNK